MKVHILSCQIFQPYIEEIILQTSLDYEYVIEYFEIDQHNHPEILNGLLQEKIDSIQSADLILMIYGICGNATKGIKARNTRIMIPRVHDCATILLGSKNRFEEVFGHRPSQGWKCLSYDKGDSHTVTLDSNPEYQDFLERFGEDNAVYLFEMLYPKTKQELYITFGLQEDNIRINELESDTEIIKGNLQFLTNVLSLKFEELLIVEPGEQIELLYDKEKVMAKK